jgi:4-amino-4-deoxy-L-arabinose transferase-like glycosyltransferase
VSVQDETAEVDAPESDAVPIRRRDAVVSKRRRWLPLVAIAAAAFVLRLIMIFAIHPLCDFDPAVWDRPAEEVKSALEFPDRATTGCMALEGDAAYVYLQGRMIADGQGYNDPLRYLNDGSSSPSAWKPPAGPTIVASMAAVGLTSPDASRALGALYGSATVLLLGALAWRLAGRPAGLLTAGIAAVFPVFVTNDWKMLAESPFALIVSGSLLLSYRLWERPTVGRAVALGALIGVGGYVRYETPALLIFLVLPLVVGFGWLSAANRFRILVTVVLATFVVWTPLLITNQVRFEKRSFVAPGSGWSLKNGSCDSTWYGDALGTLDFSCFDLATDVAVLEATSQYGERPDESVVDAVYRERARAYIDENLPRAPWVMTVRGLRLWGLWAPGEVVATDAALESRGEFDSWAALIGLYVVVPFAVVGAVAFGRRRIPVSPVVGLVAMTTISAMASFALTRYRVAADVALVLVAGVGLDAIWRGLRAKSGPFGALSRLPADAAEAVVRRTEATTRRGWRPPRAVGAVIGVALVLASGLVVWSSQSDPRPRRAVDPSACPAMKRFVTITEGDLNPAVVAPMLAEVATIGSETEDPEVRAATETLQRFTSQVVAASGDPRGITVALRGVDFESAIAAIDLLVAVAGRSC